MSCEDQLGNQASQQCNFKYQNMISKEAELHSQIMQDSKMPDKKLEAGLEDAEVATPKSSLGHCQWLYSSVALSIAASGLIHVAVMWRLDAAFTRFGIIYGGVVFQFIVILSLLGTLLWILGILGLVGILKERRPITSIFEAGLYIVCTSEIIIIALYLIRMYLGGASDTRVAMLKSMELYGTADHEYATRTWDLMQTNFQCCGVDGYLDWMDQMTNQVKPHTLVQLPPSCCVAKVTSTPWLPYQKLECVVTKNYTVILSYFHRKSFRNDQSTMLSLLPSRTIKEAENDPTSTLTLFGNSNEISRVNYISSQGGDIVYQSGCFLAYAELVGEEIYHSLRIIGGLSLLVYVTLLVSSIALKKLWMLATDTHHENALQNV